MRIFPHLKAVGSNFFCPNPPAPRFLPSSSCLPARRHPKHLPRRVEQLVGEVRHGHQQETAATSSPVMCLTVMPSNGRRRWILHCHGSSLSWIDVSELSRSATTVRPETCWTAWLQGSAPSPAWWHKRLQTTLATTPLTGQEVASC
jgi:hypothetical protein